MDMKWKAAAAIACGVVVTVGAVIVNSSRNAATQDSKSDIASAAAAADASVARPANPGPDFARLQAESDDFTLRCEAAIETQFGLQIPPSTLPAKAADAGRQWPSVGASAASGGDGSISGSKWGAENPADAEKARCLLHRSTQAALLAYKEKIKASAQADQAAAENSAAEQELAELRARDAALTARIQTVRNELKQMREATGGDPDKLSRFAFPGGVLNAMHVCNRSGTRIRVGMVWQNSKTGWLAALGTPAGFVAAGFQEISRGGCLRIGFGALNGPITGFLSEFRYSEEEETWIADGSFIPDPANSNSRDARAYSSVRWICWPQSDPRTVDPNGACPQNLDANVRFSIAFDRSSNARDYSIEYIDGGFRLTGEVPK